MLSHWPAHHIDVDRDDPGSGGSLLNVFGFGGLGRFCYLKVAQVPDIKRHIGAPGLPLLNLRCVPDGCGIDPVHRLYYFVIDAVLERFALASTPS